MGNTNSTVKSGPNNNSANANLLNSKNAPLPEERSLLLGVFNDTLKTVAKILTGSLFSDVLKGMIQDKNQTWENVVYQTCIDSLPSRFFTDLVNSLVVRMFSGNHSFFGLFNIPYIPPELSSQILATPMVTFFRASTAKQNTNAKSVKGNTLSKEELEIKKQLKELNPWLYRTTIKLQDYFKKYLKPGLDKVFHKILGIKVGKTILDKEGNPILKANGKKFKTNTKINNKQLFGIMAGTYLGSMFLPRHTTAFGFEKARSLPRALFAIISTTLFRTNTTLIHNGVSMGFESGKNFDACFHTSVIAKTLVPFLQYTSDGIGGVLAKYIPINGAWLAMTMRILAEIPATFLASPIMNLAKADRSSPKWKYLAHKLWKPVAKVIETATKPLFRFVARTFYSPFGLFPKYIPNMYDVDIRTQETKDKEKLDPTIESQFKSSALGDLSLFISKLIRTPKDMNRLFKNCLKHSREFNQVSHDVIKKQNQKIDTRIEAEKALAELNLDGLDFKPQTEEQEKNREIISLARARQVKELNKLLSAPISKHEAVAA